VYVELDVKSEVCVRLLGRGRWKDVCLYVFCSVMIDATRERTFDHAVRRWTKSDWNARGLISRRMHERGRHRDINVSGECVHEKEEKRERESEARR
jgi:hypothetical protein